ncbi:AbfB domain-containing protein [Streptomyces sp. NPDC085946]|uniref:AbfB domain-containing protein n=1 Tax=Streptomyces sp. NPDC085946 TaxID=3365744 RepID=UPI0037D1385A
MAPKAASSPGRPRSAVRRVVRAGARAWAPPPADAGQPASFTEQIRVHEEAGSGGLFRADATFCPVRGADGGVRLSAYDFPEQYPRHHDARLWPATPGGTRPWDSPPSSRRTPHGPWRPRGHRAPGLVSERSGRRRPTGRRRPLPVPAPRGGPGRPDAVRAAGGGVRLRDARGPGGGALPPPGPPVVVRTTASPPRGARSPPRR